MTMEKRGCDIGCLPAWRDAARNDRASIWRVDQAVAWTSHGNALGVNRHTPTFLANFLQIAGIHHDDLKRRSNLPKHRRRLDNPGGNWRVFALLGGVHVHAVANPVSGRIDQGRERDSFRGHAPHGNFAAGLPRFLDLAASLLNLVGFLPGIVEKRAGKTAALPRHGGRGLFTNAALQPQILSAKVVSGRYVLDARRRERLSRA